MQVKCQSLPQSHTRVDIGRSDCILRHEIDTEHQAYLDRSETWKLYYIRYKDFGLLEEQTPGIMFINSRMAWSLQRGPVAAKCKDCQCETDEAGIESQRAR
jgi:hypothetical protein